MRPPTACEFCRSRRRRCQRLPPSNDERCALCRKHNVPCIPSNVTSVRSDLISPISSSHSHQSRYDASLDGEGLGAAPASEHQESPFTTSTAPAVHTPGNSTQDVLLPAKPVCFHLASLYFDYIHDQLHTLFHKPSFMADIATDRTPRVVLFAMIALAARFSSHPLFASQSPRTRGMQYAHKSAMLLDVTDVSLETIQACVMLGACRIIEGDAPGESIYYGIACRMAQLMDLPHRACESRLAREINIRVWHTLCMVDEWSSSGVQVPRQIPNPPDDIPLPGEEMLFLQMRNTDLQRLHTESTQCSLLGEMINLSRIFRDINQINDRAVELPHDPETIGSLSARLENWENDLPAYMRDEPENLAYYAAQGLGRIYVAVYLGFYHYGQLLYYRFLDGASTEEDSPLIDTFARRCKSHAARLCQMVYAAMDTPGCDVLYNMVGHVLVIASTVQIHTLLFSPSNTEISAARQRLERNFNILLRLREFWPSLDFCMMRLQAFHKACRTSMSTPFKLDRWMLKFLSEFAKPVEDRPEGTEPGDWIIGDIAVTPTSDLGVNSIAAVFRNESSS